MKESLYAGDMFAAVSVGVCAKDVNDPDDKNNASSSFLFIIVKFQVLQILSEVKENNYIIVLYQFKRIWFSVYK
jgi:hypothetical protein